MKSQRKSALFYCFLLYFMYCVKLPSFRIEMLAAWGEMECNRELNIHGYLILCFVWNQLTFPFPLLLLFSVNRNFVLSTHVI